MGTVGKSLTISGMGSLLGGDLSRAVSAAVAAEAHGFDRVVLTDHVVMGEDHDGYPYGEFPFGPDEPWPDPMLLLAAIAQATQRIRLATGVLIAPLRPAIVLAKQAATLDALSRGRLDLGVGSGWQAAEHTAAGFSPKGRDLRLEDTVRACQALWRDAPASFSSTTVSFERLWCVPRPAQPGGPPIWFGGGAHSAAAARVAVLGAGWMPLLGGEALRDGIDLMRSACASVGRAPSTLRVMAPAPTVRRDDGTADPTLSVEAAHDLASLGVTDVTFNLARWARSPDEIDDALAALGAA